jgi:phenylacetate-CoA ligase
MSFIEKIYDNSPVVIQNLFCSVKGFLICRRRFNRNFYKYLQKFEKKEYDPVQSLKSFLYAVSETPFYKKSFSEYGFNINAEDIYAELKKLPVINKEIVKKDVKLFFNPKCKAKTIEIKTSGSTGSGLTLLYTIEMENKQWAVNWRYRRLNGIEMDWWCGWFGGRKIISLKNKIPPFWRINKPGKQVMFSAYHLGGNTVESYYNEINKRQLKWLHGYPSQISLLASLIYENNLPPLLCVKNITLSSETLLENQKDILKRIFPNARISQHYGLTEGVASIYQNAQDELIINNDYCYIEFIPIESNENLYKIVGTGFSNEAFPLIRYDTGDIAEFVVSADGGKKLVGIDGRIEDFIILPNGVKLGRLCHTFINITVIKEVQIHQRDLYHIDFNIVKGKGYTAEDEKKLMKEVRERIDDSVFIAINYVDTIPRTKTGKLRLVVSDIC